MAKNETMSGVIERVVTDKGFGFIKGTDGVSYFYHRSEMVSPFYFGPENEGKRVTFTVAPSPKGPRATAVTAA